MAVRLHTFYDEEVAPYLLEHFKYKSVMEIPRLEKVVLNMGVGEAVQNSKAIEGAVEDLTAITGQKPSIRRAKKSCVKL